MKHDSSNLMLKIIILRAYDTFGTTKVTQEVDQLLFTVALFLYCF